MAGLVWLCGDSDVDHLARELHRSRAMVKKYKPRRESLNTARRAPAAPGGGEPW